MNGVEKTKNHIDDRKMVGQRENVFDGSLSLIMVRGAEPSVYCRAHTIYSHLGAI